MVVKVFFTGVTGFIGGTAFYYIHDAHHGKEYEYSVLIRDQARAKQVKEKYPDVNIIYGTLEDSEIVEKAAAEADIVIHTADSSDNTPGATAIGKGLKAGHTREIPGYWLHLSGTGILTWWDDIHKRAGEPPLPEQTYSDVDGVDRLVTLPLEAWHRDVDKLVQSFISDAVRVAIICPPTIYGVGSGECIKSSDQIPHLARYILHTGHGPIIGKGETEWDNVHIDDLGRLYLLLFEAFLDEEKRGDPELFGPKAYFLTGSGVHNWAEVTKQMAALVGKPTKPATLDEVMANKYGKSTWGLNSKGVAQRARRYLGWEARGPPLQETLPEAMEIERIKLLL